jgi:asparagine synthase (glutamine-hydrolysing)
MCGIFGVYLNSRTESFDRSIFEKCSNILSHRGPDDRGTYVDVENNIFLGHTRLSILDLSPLGHQPMQSYSGKYYITFNGEIYNFQALKKELVDSELFEGTFRGSSDTEVMLACFEAYGLEKAVQKFNGMFSFGLYDTINCTLTLCTDRLGVKPLYYSIGSRAIIFASELKAILGLQESGFVTKDLCREGIKEYLTFGYIRAPYTPYKYIYKLEPGSILTFHLSEMRDSTLRSYDPFKKSTASQIQYTKYWDIKDQELKSDLSLNIYSKDTVLNMLNDLLHDAISLRMIADVPLGLFLSGGIDSSLIAAIITKHRSERIQTFSIGFNDTRYNEAPDAQRVSQLLNTEHHEFYVTPKEIVEGLKNLPLLFDEPFADQSFLPTYFLSKLASKHVKVALTGDGGDELFGGYSRYLWGEKIASYHAKLPPVYRKIISKILMHIPVNCVNAFGGLCSWLAPSLFRLHSSGEKFHKVAALFQTETFDELYERMVSIIPIEKSIELTKDKVFFQKKFTQHTALKYMQYWDIYNYLPYNILVKADRATMLHSIEGREPLLDYRLAEFAMKLPHEMKINNNVTKRVLRMLLARYLPKDMIERPKRGFSVPISSWLRTELRSWGEGIVQKNDPFINTFIDPEVISLMWGEHLSGKRDHGMRLWTVIVLKEWLKSHS